MIYDGHRIQFGCDASTSPLILKGEYNKHSVNRIYRGGVNDTRPPFFHMKASFDNDEDKREYEYSATNAIFYYSGYPGLSEPHLIVACGDRILKGKVYKNNVVFSRLHFGLSRKEDFGFFVKAGPILVYQNGVDLPVYWNGRTGSMKQVIQSSAVGGFPMMVGRAMTYAHGRIFVIATSGLVYASDHIYSQGLQPDNLEAVLRFEESTYPDGGDGFGAPADLGKAIGITVIKQSSQFNGHGDVLVLCENGSYTIKAAEIRKTGDVSGTTDPSIQASFLFENGCSSPNAVISRIGDIVYRSSDLSVTTIKIEIANEQDVIQQDIFVSEAVNPYLKFDTSSDVQYSTATSFEDRNIFSFLIRKKLDGSGGVHKYAEGMVVMDSAPSSGKKFTWDGIWTGPRVTACCNGVFDKIKYAFFMSHDKDGVNRLYTLERSRKNDILSTGEVKIKSMYVTGQLFDDRAGNNPGTLKSVKTSCVNLTKVVNSANAKTSLNTGGMVCFFPMADGPVGCEDCQLTEEEKICLTIGGDIGDYEGYVVSNVPCPQSIESKKVRGVPTDGFYFDLKTNIEGVAVVDHNIVFADKSVTNFQEYLNECLKKGSNCNPERCCPIIQELFEYQF